MKEIWKDVKDYEDLYRVSNLGNVYNTRFKRRLKLAKLSGRNYWCVGLSRNDIRKRYRVHRLVAQAFIPNPGNKPQVNHIDGNGLNNNLSNLEWCTQSENVLHAYRELGRAPTSLGKFGKDHHGSIPFWIKFLDGKIERFWGRHELEREAGLNGNSVGTRLSIMRKENKTEHTFTQGKMKGLTIYLDKLKEKV